MRKEPRKPITTKVTRAGRIEQDGDHFAGDLEVLSFAKVEYEAGVVVVVVVVVVMAVILY